MKVTILSDDSELLDTVEVAETDLDTDGGKACIWLEICDCLESGRKYLNQKASPIGLKEKQMSTNTMKAIWILLIGTVAILLICLWFGWKLLVVLILWEFVDAVAKYKGE